MLATFAKSRSVSHFVLSSSISLISCKSKLRLFLFVHLMSSEIVSSGPGVLLSLNFPKTKYNSCKWSGSSFTLSTVAGKGGALGFWAGRSLAFLHWTSSRYSAALFAYWSMGIRLPCESLNLHNFWENFDLSVFIPVQLWPC